ncbi:hypothetical protein A2U01_0101455, partial [Trifolium medium]|nr:hypothetical protein [Trifolium medium]
EAAGINFDDSEDERALGLDDGFDVVLEPPPPPPLMVDVSGSKKSVAKRKTPKKANVVETGSSSAVDDEFEMEEN